MAWLQDLQTYLIGLPGAWLPLAMLLAAYPAQWKRRQSDLAAGLVLLSWVLVLLHCVSELRAMHGAVSSENPMWFELNLSGYHELVLIPVVIKHVVFTLPFLTFAPLRLPKMEGRLVMMLGGFALIDMWLLSVFHLRLAPSMS